MGNQFQKQRYEHKYIISEQQALAVREFVQSYLSLDDFGATQPNNSYPVHSLYLDSDDLRLYRSTINGDKNRYKLRLRFYENREKAPVYFEIKRRTDNTISKLRAGVHREVVDRVLLGEIPRSEEMFSLDPGQMAAIQEFVRLMESIQANPKAHVAYLREAWVSQESNSVRVTLDRDVCCDPEPTARLCAEMLNPVTVFGDRVILELKFTNRYPEWFRLLVETFGLMQEGAAKYVDGVDLIGAGNVRRAFAFEGKSPSGKEGQSMDSNSLAAGYV